MPRKFNILPILLSFFFLSAVSCRTQRQIQYVPVESSRTAFEIDSLNRLVKAMAEHNRATREIENVSVKETNTYTLNDRGDTIKIVTEKEKDSSKEVQRLEQYYLAIIDSISRTKVRVDSVDRPVPYPVTEYVEVNVLAWWQKGLMWIGGIGLLYAGFNIFGMMRKNR